MPSFIVSTDQVIEARIDDVWAVLVDTERWHEWCSVLHFESGPVEVGERPTFSTHTTERPLVQLPAHDHVTRASRALRVGRTNRARRGIRPPHRRTGSQSRTQLTGQARGPLCKTNAAAQPTRTPPSRHVVAQNNEEPTASHLRPIGTYRSVDTRSNTSDTPSPKRSALRRIAGDMWDRHRSAAGGRSEDSTD